MPLYVGTPIEHGDHAGGCFGRDFYGPGRIEALGVDWVVARDGDGKAWFCPYAPHELELDLGK